MFPRTGTGTGIRNPPAPAATSRGARVSPFQFPFPFLFLFLFLFSSKSPHVFPGEAQVAGYFIREETDMIETRAFPPVAAAAPPPTLPQEPSPSPAAPLAQSWTERVLDGASSGATAAGWAQEGQRLAVGIGLASLFGAALGLRVGGAAILGHAFGVSTGLFAVCGLAVPALAIVLALVNASVDAFGLARATSRGAATAGLLLAGLAPGAALFALTVEDAITVTLVGAGGLALGGVLGMRSFVRALAPQIHGSDGRARRLSMVAVPLFLVFAAILGARIWWVMLPIVRGG